MRRILHWQKAGSRTVTQPFQFVACTSDSQISSCRTVLHGEARAAACKLHASPNAAFHQLASGPTAVIFTVKAFALQAQDDRQADSGSVLSMSEDEIAAAAIPTPPQPDRRWGSSKTAASA